MSSVTVTLKKQGEDRVESQVGAGGYSDSSDYVLDLIHRDRERRLEELREKVRFSFERGVSDKRMSDIVAEGDRRLRDGR